MGLALVKKGVLLHAECFGNCWPGITKILLPVFPLVGAGGAEVPVCADAGGVETGLQVVGAGVGSTLDGAALNYLHTNQVRITASAGAGPQVPWACQAGGIGDVHGGATQLLGID